MTKRWDPAKFKDEYREDVLALVRKKVRSRQTHTILEPEAEEEAPAPRREVVDLMPLLKQSLERRSRGGEAKERKEGARASSRSPRRPAAARRPKPAARRASGGRGTGARGARSRRPPSREPKSA
jgi:DNA end-binding protein Ku